MQYLLRVALATFVVLIVTFTIHGLKAIAATPEERGSRISDIYYADTFRFTKDLAHATSTTLTNAQFGSVMRELFLDMEQLEGGRRSRMVETYTNGSAGLKRALEAGAKVQLKRETAVRDAEAKRAKAAERELE